MADKKGKIVLKVEDKRVFFEADLWLLWVLLGILLALMGKPEIVSLFEEVLGMIK
jgi:hypothetical protein